MGQLTVADLVEALKDVPPHTPVVFQGNVWDEDEEDGERDEPGYTTCLGYVYSAFVRRQEGPDTEFVIDGAITESES